jgi:hypothetical protein
VRARQDRQPDNVRALVRDPLPIDVLRRRMTSDPANVARVLCIAI